jgi:hypothetical protein
MDEVKEVAITGNPDKIMGFSAKGRKRGTRRRGGFEIDKVIREETPVAPVTAAPVTATSAPMPATVTAAPQPVPATVTVAPQLVAPVGGAKVHIAPKKKVHRIILTKKQRAPVTDIPVQKKKTQRRVTIATQHLQHRMRKAHTTRKASRTLPLDKIRAHLIEKNIIKPTSKAPEAVLRQMYADSLIVSQKAL